MPISQNKAPLIEQTICLTCGFCCDGTLFQYAHLNQGERGHLPEKIEQNSYTKGKKDYFRLPCLYFNEKCTIYESKRANICASYRCQLLKDVAAGKIALNEALDVVKEASELRKKLFDQYLIISGNGDEIYFRKLLSDLGKIIKNASESDPLFRDYEMLLAKCNIFEALLIKHIRSATDFENIMITSQEDKKETI